MIEIMSLDEQHEVVWDVCFFFFFFWGGGGGVWGVSEFGFRFYIYYTELSRIANGDLLDLYFITKQQGIF